MKVKNNHHKRLIFEIDGVSISIDSGETKRVKKELGQKLLSDPNIEKVKSKKKSKKSKSKSKTKKAKSKSED